MLDLNTVPPHVLGDAAARRPDAGPTVVAARDARPIVLAR